MIGYAYDDGGRAAAGFRGDARDCVARALAIALRPAGVDDDRAPEAGLHYLDVYDTLAALMERTGEPRSARNGVSTKVARAYLREQGWTWTPTMAIGTGCTVHLRADELPAGRIIVRLSKHLCAVIDGVVHDTHDPSRDGTRCVYGYWTKEEA